jgi:hypothetical protein
LQVELDALFVAVEHGEKPRARTQQMTGAITLDGFDLDDLGAHIGQHHAAGGAHDHVGELDDAQAFERELPCRFAHAHTQR